MPAAFTDSMWLHKHLRIFYYRNIIESIICKESNTLDLVLMLKSHSWTSMCF